MAIIRRNTKKSFKKFTTGILLTTGYLLLHFLFYLQVACIVAFVLGGCYMLYTKRYTGKPEVNVPDKYSYTLPSTNKEFKIFFEKDCIAYFCSPLSSYEIIMRK